MHEIRANFLTVAIAPDNWIPMEGALGERLPTFMYDYGESSIECPIEGCSAGLRALNCHLRQSKNLHTVYITLSKNCACVHSAHVVAHTLAADTLV
jgi:hypothetical protein